MTVIELCDPHGRVLERLRATQFPVRVGRAYDNDLIVDDPYVCAHHCEIVREADGQLTVRDLGSVNGTGEATRESPLRLEQGTKVRIGRSTLCVRDPAAPVAPTRIDPARTGLAREWPPRSTLVSLAIVLVVGAATALVAFLDSTAEFKFGRYVLREQIPMLAVVALWASVWAMVSRVTMHRFAFMRHVTIAVSVMLAMLAVEFIFGFLKFGFASPRPFEIAETLVSAVAIALLLYWHLRLCGEHGRRRMALASALIAAFLTGTVVVEDYLDAREFDTAASYSATLKPPLFQFVASRPVDDFLATSADLRERVEREIAEHAAKVQ